MYLTFIALILYKSWKPNAKTQDLLYYGRSCDGLVFN